MADEQAAGAGSRPGGWVIWFTGYSGSGKSTLAQALASELQRAGAHTHVLDGDQLRVRLSADLGYRVEDRLEHLRRVAEVAAILADAGVLCIAALISPFRVARERARSIVGAGRFLEIHLDTPLAVCEARDVKGLYARARRGEVAEFTGITSPYEPPEHPDLRLDTSRTSVAECVQLLVQHLRSRGWEGTAVLSKGVT